MKTCLFGGSFDPVHAGHLTIAAAAQKQCGLDEVVFLPAACSPFKQGKNTFFSDAQRLQMLQIATADLPWANVSELDLQLPPPSWSWRVVEKCQTLYPGAELFWLMGTDQWEALERWARYDYLCEHLTFIVYHRGAAPKPREGVSSIFIEGNHPASSSAIRQAIKERLPLPDKWLPEAVQSIIASKLVK